MRSDMVVALNEASANGTTLFGLNHLAAPSQRHSLQIVPGHLHDPGQTMPIAHLNLPQVRQTFTTLGLQTHGEWGFPFGVNEHRVVVAVTKWQSRLRSHPSSFDGPDLVRLALERGRSALAALDVLTDLLDRHGQKGDHIYMIADGDEAFVVESSGRYWALLGCSHARAVTGAAMIRQDWQRLAPGLADHVIDQGWWKDDGSKIDFVRCLSEDTEWARNARKRWGRASVALSHQHGAIDLHFLRDMLAEHYTGNRDVLPTTQVMPLAASFLVDLHRHDVPTLTWFSFGVPETSLYFPICMTGELPAVFGDGMPMTTTIQERMLELQTIATGKEKDRNKLMQALERLQTKFDVDADEFQAKAHDFVQHGKPHLVTAIATEMMHQHIELFDHEYRHLFGVEEIPPGKEPVAEEMLFFA